MDVMMIDIYSMVLKGEKVLEDFNIGKEAGGSKKALVKKFEVNVMNTVMDIHFYWAGKGTCCIPFQSTYGPLVSAIHVSSGSWICIHIYIIFIYSLFEPRSHKKGIFAVSESVDSSDGSKKKKHVGKIFGIAGGSAVGMVIISSIFYLWWTKKSPKHTLLHTDSPKKGVISC